HNSARFPIVSPAGEIRNRRVWPRFQQTANGDLENVSRPISMSWWLSRPIQILLHQQTEENKNQNKNPDQIERVWRAIMSKSGCTR
ncbi:MAG: hypothetical protein WAL09_03840, partial [Pseudolabrys sp.]